MTTFTIASIKARQILDSRDNPTVEVEVGLADGSNGRAAVPSGASIGSKEALDLRDSGAPWLGQGVNKAIDHVNQTIASAILNRTFDQSTLDRTLIELDGTENKSHLGANAILGVSMAFAVACAASKKIPVYKYIGELVGNGERADEGKLANNTQFKLPVPIFNIMNGGAHANWSTDIQEYILFPVKVEAYHERLRKSTEVFDRLAELLTKKGFSTNVGDEGGYAPALSSNEEAFDLILKAVALAGYTAGQNGDFMIGLDLAASEFYAENSYHLKRDKTTKTTEEMVAWMISLCKKYPIISLEDPLAENDWNGWQQLTNAIGKTVHIIGDDLTVTNPKYIKQSIADNSCNGVIIKLNQIGTLSETLEAVKLAKAADWITIASHRSGETEDVFVVHLAVGAGCEQLKAGAPSRTDRTAKYNELLRIEEEL